MKHPILLLALTLCLTNSLFSQSYTVSTIPYNPFPLDSGIQVISNSDDIWSPPIGIGFDFNFFGKTYQLAVLGSNGILSFDTAYANTICDWDLTAKQPIPSSTVYNHSIFFPYQDIDFSNGGKVSHMVYGTLPNRKFVFSFDTVPFFDDVFFVGRCYGLPRFSGQVILHEQTNNIEIHLKNKSVCTDWNNGLAILGLQRDAALGVPVVGKNNTVWTAQNEAWLFTFDSSSVGTVLNRFSGRCIVDKNNNCQSDSTDIAIRNRPIIFKNNNTNQSVYSYCDMNGYYSKYLDTGSYTIHTMPADPDYLSRKCPSNLYINHDFPFYNDSSDNNIFADSISQHCSAIQASIAPYSKKMNFMYFAPCDTGIIKLKLSNRGYISDSIQAIFEKNDSTTILSSTVPYAIQGNKLTFNLGILPAQSDTTITLYVKIGCDAITSNYCYSLSSKSTFNTKCNSIIDSISCCVRLGVPHDPNAIYATSTLQPDKSMLKFLLTDKTDVIDYTILFQNTGSASAKNVHLELVISDKINPLTINPLSASATYNWVMIDSLLIVDFFNINLPDSTTNPNGSIGYFSFRAQQKNTNQYGQEIDHQVAIFFDYLSPILTNTSMVLLVYNAPSGIDAAQLSNSVVYPNPTSGIVTITSDERSTIHVYDVLDRPIFHDTNPKKEFHLNLDENEPGVYLIIIENKLGRKVFKVIKE
jgi:uncharacterized repeat protein (TIGR01451 family)